jgi:hypothetical protein
LYLCGNPNKLGELFVTLEKNPYICKPCPYGDGKSAEKKRIAYCKFSFVKRID